MTDKPLTIVALDAENVKRLTAVHIEPDGSLVQITGKNRQGKTSVLDAIWWALETAKHIQRSPIRRGAKTAKIRVDLGDLVVTRKFKERDPEKVKQGDKLWTTSLTIENEEGARFQRPAEMLEALVGALSFDPLEFTRMAPKQQVEMLRLFVTDVDFDKLDRERAGYYAERTDLNRDAKSLRAQAEGIIVPDGLPDEPIDMAELEAKLENAGEVNAGITRQRDQRDAQRNLASMRREQHDRVAREIQQTKEAIAELQKKMVDLESEAAKLIHEAGKIEADLKKARPLPEPVSTGDLRERLAEARDTNTMIAQRDERDRLIEEAREFEEASADRTAAIARIDAAKEKAIAESEMPVEGIGFEEDHFTLNGVPFDQASDAEQLEASLAIAMAMNPRVRVVRIRDGSLLDSDALARIGEVAEQKGYQIWIERVDDTGKVGVVIEDGHVKGQELPEAAE